MNPNTAPTIVLPYRSEPGYHRHACMTCGVVWEHGDDCINDEPAHTCPQCGRVEWWHYRGPMFPTAEAVACAHALPV